MSVLEHGREAALSCSIARMKKAKSGKRDSLMKGSKSLKNAARKKATAKKKAVAKGEWKKKSAAKDRIGPKKKRASNKAAPKSVDEYLAAVPEPARNALNQIREAIRSVVPAEATEIISYQIPAFKHRRVLVWYAAFANHCSLFPTAFVIEAFKDDLKGFSISKGTVQFPLDNPMPVELIKRMVRERVTAAKAGSS
jgi:uncharacterized protein YdhG (YjbR/CyaY superfamily)